MLAASERVGILWNALPCASAAELRGVSSIYKSAPTTSALAWPAAMLKWLLSPGHVLHRVRSNRGSWSLIVTFFSRPSWFSSCSG